MKKLLYELFELLDDGRRYPETEQAERAAEPWVKRLDELARDDDEFDQIWDAALGVGAAETPVWFARGFRMGARIMLEILGDSGYV